MSIRFRERYRMPQFKLDEILGYPNIFKSLKPMRYLCGPVISVPIEYTGEWVEDFNVVNKKENV